MERNFFWYKWKNPQDEFIDVIITQRRNEKFSKIVPLIRTDSQCLFRLSDCESIDINEKDTKLSKDDEYTGYWCGSDEVVCKDIVDQKAKKKLLRNIFVSKTYFLDDLYERELLTLTDDNFDWLSEKTIFFRNCFEEKFSREEAMEIWRKKRKHYKHGPAVDIKKASFDVVWKELLSLKDLGGICQF